MPDHLALAQHRYAEQGADATERHGFGRAVFRVGGEVDDMHDPTVQRHAPGDRAAVGGKAAVQQRRPRIRSGNACAAA